MSTTSETPVQTYDLGDDVTIRGQWQTRAGEFTDPDTVFVQVESPDPDVAIVTKEYGLDAEVVKEDVGKYKMIVDGNYPGTWYYRFYSTGEGKAAKERAFVIARSRFD